MTNQCFLKDHKGAVVVDMAFIAYILLFMFLCVFLYMRASIITSGVHETMRGAVIDAVSANYITAFDAMGEGATDAYNADDGWADSATDGNLVNQVVSNLGLSGSGDGYAKEADGEDEYAITNVSVNVQNPPIRDSNTQLQITVAYTLVVYMPLHLPSLSFPQTVSASFEPKF